MSETKGKKSPLFVIFTTVLVDLIGFGMVIPLVGLYGRHYGATALQLSILGAIFSVLQFFFTPLWGSLSDRLGRRPIILISLAGSTISYLIFGLAPNYTWLLVARAFGGLFAANISAAQAYIADVTPPKDRAKGMGLIGAAFGIGFTLGPPLGGLSAAKLGLAAPGFIAAAICGINFFLAVFRLPESLTAELRAKASRRSLAPLQIKRLLNARNHPDLWFLLMAAFLITFAFSNMEQTFSLLFQTKFSIPTGEAGLKTGMVLMVSSIIGAIIQGGLIRKLAPRFGERNLLMTGLVFNLIAMSIFPFGPTYWTYFVIAIPLSFGSALINPSLAALISQTASESEQGETLGLYQGLASLARAAGPFYGLMTFSVQYFIPYLTASLISLILLMISIRIWKGATQLGAAQKGTHLA
jgi:multidrug resistance protein